MLVCLNSMARHVRLIAWKYHVLFFFIFLRYLLQCQKKANSSGAIKDKIKHGILTKLVANIHAIFLFQLWARWHIHAFCGCFAKFLQGMRVLFYLFFTFSNFWWLDLHNETCVALANLRWSFSKNWIENWTSWFSYGYWKCMFVDSLTEYIGPPNCVHYWVYSS